MIPTDIQPSVLAILYALRGIDRDDRRVWVRRHLSGMHWVGGSDPFSYEMAFDFALERGLVEVRTVKRHRRSGKRWNGPGQRAWTDEFLYATRAGHRLFLASMPHFNKDRQLGWRSAIAMRPRVAPEKAVDPHYPLNGSCPVIASDWLYGYDCFLLTRTYRLDAANF